MLKLAVVWFGLVAVLVAAPPLATGAEMWTENAKEAMAQAARENKDLLIDVTGSDWCIWCIRLEDEVFSKEPFVTEAPNHFVLLKLDFPRKKKQSEELKKQNRGWRSKLPFGGFPTIFLADAAGKPYAKTGYRRGGAGPYVKHLNELRKIRKKRDEPMAKAKAAEGIERAKLLDEAMSALDPSLVMRCYADVVEEIVRLDPENKAGLKDKYGAMALMNKINMAMQRRQLDQVVELADQALKTLGKAGQAAQDIYFAKSVALYGKKDKPGAKKALEAALRAAPQGSKAGQIKGILQRLFKDVR